MRRSTRKRWRVKVKSAVVVVAAAVVVVVSVKKT